MEALRWISKYIRKFGGNPDNVTILGQSAGNVELYEDADELHAFFLKAESVVLCYWSAKLLKDYSIGLSAKAGLVLFPA